MEIYVVKHTDGRYVAADRTRHPYTPDIKRAVFFDSREEAERNACPGNECVSTVATELNL